jgi:hypothetical protein
MRMKQSELRNKEEGLQVGRKSICTESSQCTTKGCKTLLTDQACQHSITLLLNLLVLHPASCLAHALITDRSLTYSCAPPLPPG